MGKFTLHFIDIHQIIPDGTGGKELPANARDLRDLGLIPGSGRYPGEGNGNPLQDSCLKNPMDRGDWSATTVHGITKGGHNLATRQQ